VSRARFSRARGLKIDGLLIGVDISTYFPLGPESPLAYVRGNFAWTGNVWSLQSFGSDHSNRNVHGQHIFGF
jgi:hypothetical protein